MHGRGTYTYADGENWEGEWKDDEWHEDIAGKRPGAPRSAAAEGGAAATDPRQTCQRVLPLASASTSGVPVPPAPSVPSEAQSAASTAPVSSETLANHVRTTHECRHARALSVESPSARMCTHARVARAHALR